MSDTYRKRVFWEAVKRCRERGGTTVGMPRMDTSVAEAYVTELEARQCGPCTAIGYPETCVCALGVNETRDRKLSENVNFLAAAAADVLEDYRKVRFFLGGDDYENSVDKVADLVRALEPFAIDRARARETSLRLIREQINARA